MKDRVHSQVGIVLKTVCYVLFILGCGDQQTSVNGVDDAAPDLDQIPPAMSDAYIDAASDVQDADPEAHDGRVTIIQDMGPPSEVYWTTERVFQALTPTCVACHTSGQTFPYFENLGDFHRLLLVPDDWVVAGEPENSPLLDLLAGEHDGRFQQMPPSGPSYIELTADDPDTPTLDELSEWIRTLNADEVVPDVPCLDTPTPKILHRLNRLEYNRAVQHLTGTHQNPADDFPSEDKAYGLDNIAQALVVSPLLVEKYELAAKMLSEEMIVPQARQFRARHYEAETDLESRVGRAQGTYWNLWSNGLLSREVILPAAGLYTLRVSVTARQAGPDPARLSFQINEEIIGLFDVLVDTPELQVIELPPRRLSAGLNIIGVRFRNDYNCTQANFDLGRCNALGDRNLYVDYLELDGPELEPNQVPNTFEFDWFENCDLTQGDASLECARAGLERFARLVWRRSLAPEEFDRLWALVTAELDQPEGLRAGIRQAIHALLLSPKFLFRFEVDSGPGESLTGPERATRLAAFLWRSVPDEELIDSAESGGLDTDEGMLATAEAMLNDDRSTAMINDLGAQWFLQEHTQYAEPEYDLFPDFDEPLRAAMLRETELFFEAIWSEDQSLLDIVDAQSTFVNERLAQHYGLEGIEGDEFVRVEPMAAHRGGILTQGSWLTATSHSTRTSPVKRGQWVLENLLCAPPPPPPPGVEGLVEPMDMVDQDASLRVRLEQHRADPACASCHTHMDAIGFALEQYDAIGAFRTHDEGEVIEPAGELPGGAQFEDGVDLGRALRGHPDLGPCVTDKLLIYALGRGLHEGERCFVDEVVSDAILTDYQPSEVINSIVTSPLFTVRGLDPEEGGTP